MISVIATITTREGGVAALLEHINDNLSNVRAESGCIEYLPMLDAESGMAAQVKAANVVIMLEKWETMEALHDHSVAPHMLDYREKVKDIVQSVSLKVLAPA